MGFFISFKLDNQLIELKNSKCPTSTDILKKELKSFEKNEIKLNEYKSQNRADIKNLESKILKLNEQLTANIEDQAYIAQLNK